MDSARFQTNIHMFNALGNVHFKARAFVLRRIDISTPTDAPSVDFSRLKETLNLADPNFDEPSPIDIVLGADVYESLMLSGLQHFGSLLAQDTVFGWTLTGKISGKLSGSTLMANTCLSDASPSPEPCHEELLGLVQRFWAMEEVPQVRRISAADKECEEIYSRGHSRDPTGRYIVPLHLKAGGVDLLGDSLSQARAALASTHRRMERDAELNLHYRKFMEEYIRLGHMRLLSSEELTNHAEPTHYIPHHGIWQNSDDGRKLRVVFNASRPTTSGRSLNDVLHAGPKLQNSIAEVITRWRRYRYAFCADIKTMFRQIRVIDSHTHLQRVLWSPSADSPALHYALLTATYGTACAPYLAIRTLHQLSSDEGEKFPEATDAINRELYVDDFLSGGHDLSSARRRRNQLVELLKAGGLTLKKWVTNEAQLLDDIPHEDRLRPDWLHFSTNGPVDELGVTWDPVGDRFTFRSPKSEPNVVLTKRKALAELARVFDPLGWLAPITLLAKLIIQDLWRAKLTWDEELPRPWIEKWLIFRESMSHSSVVSIQRWIEYESRGSIELHAFSDASRRAMACVVFSRTISESGSSATRILGAKTKLTPIRTLKPSSRPSTRMTIPRLELRAALLAARQLQALALTLDIPLANCHLWTDSRIALSWIGSDAPVGNDIVDNYVAQIQELSSEATWHHVPTEENPADVASRGSDMLKLEDFSLWWNGPEWLLKAPECWPQVLASAESCEASCDSHVLPPVKCLTVQVAPTSHNHIERFSNLISLLRGTARVRRLFGRRAKSPTTTLLRSPTAPMTADELQRAFLICVKLCQGQTFTREISELLKNRPVPIKRRRLGSHAPNQITSNRSLRPLAPFLDDDGIMRAGGRLTNSHLPYDEKHPVILDGRTHLAKLIIRWGHERSLHAGFRATYAWVIQRAWIINAKVLVKAHIRACLVCARIAARPASQGMAPLPSARVIPSRPFERCGVDYAGPFQISRAKGRGVASFKGYVALFVCLSTKAVHLELVGDLTTSSFLGALTRFAGRRGRPAEIWSDNGTNFRGANAELQRLLIEAEMNWGLIEGQLAQDGITWKFIPPAAPHFGGLWEPGVKSMKAHLRRVAGPRRLTYEEFSTLLVSIEAVLNSRLLTPPSGELDDLEALTPNHLLMGTSAASYPQPSHPDSNLDHAAHWELVKGMRDRIFSQWSKEYLNTLIQRPKWRAPEPNFRVGDFAVIIDASLLRPDGRWPMGRVIAVHPGPDGLVRAVTVKTSTGEYVRPIVKLARLPLYQPPDPSPNDEDPSSSS